MIFHVACQYKVIHVGQGSPTYGLRAKCGHFKKAMALFKSKGAKEKRSPKKFSKIGKKVRVDGPRQKKVPNFPIFGPPTTKGWRLLM